MFSAGELADGVSDLLVASRRAVLVDQGGAGGAVAHAVHQFALLLESTHDGLAAPSDGAGLTADDRERINGVIRRPSRIDAATVENRRKVLAGQRHTEDTLGPREIIVPVTTQLNKLRELTRVAAGPHRDELVHLVAEWTAFVGWLHTAVRKDADALALFTEAEDLADDVGDGTVAATAASFRGYLALLQGRPRYAIRASAAALAAPGAHPRSTLTICSKPPRRTQTSGIRRKRSDFSPRHQILPRRLASRLLPSTGTPNRSSG
jgi:hypothetical protein